MKPFICPQPGRRILHLDCSEMKQHSLEEATQILLELGFTPNVEYRYKADGLALILVLANEPFNHDFGEAFDKIAAIVFTLQGGFNRLPSPRSRTRREVGV
jgi:hypothetical protein